MVGMNVRAALVRTALVGMGSWVRALPPVAPSVLAAWWPFSQTMIVTAYFTDGGRLFPVSRRIPVTDNLPRATLQVLLDGPGPASGVTSPIPGGMQIRSLTVSEGVARLDLSHGGSSPLTDAARAAIVETMTRVPGIRAVVLSVEGNTRAMSSTGQPLLYYASPKGLVAVRAGAGNARDAVMRYLSSTVDGLTGIPRDVRLRNYAYDQSQGQVSLDFTYTPSIRTLAIEEPDMMRFVLLGLVTSLTEFPEVRTVRIDFEGRTQLGLGECSDLLRTPQRRPRLLNDERLLGG